jgi:tetratricopeptide (TPR) repeat protein
MAHAPRKSIVPSQPSTEYQCLSSTSDLPCALFLYALAIERLDRHFLLNQREDLNKSIHHLTGSILLPPFWWLPHGPLILQAFLDLALALLSRSLVSNQPEDAISAARYLSHLRDQPHEISDTPRHCVTKFLVYALASQVKLGAGNVMENIREISILCHGLFTLETLVVDTTDLVHLIFNVLLSNIFPGVLDQPLDELIECLRAAKKRRPDLLKARISLAMSLIARYSTTYMNDDYEEAASILDKIITSGSPGDSQDEFATIAQGIAITFAGKLAGMRSTAHEDPEYSEEAIYCARAFHSSSSAKEIFHSSVGFQPEDLAKRRFKYFGPIEGLEASSDNSFLLSQPVSVTSQTIDRMKSLLVGIRDNDDTTKIDEAIENGRTMLAAHPPTDPFKPFLFELLGQILYEAFERTEMIKYLNESIGTRRQVFDYPIAHPLRFRAYNQLSRTLLARFVFFPGHCMQDLDEGIHLLSQCASDRHVNFPKRFHFACEWAYVARRTRHHTLSTAYESAVSLMQGTLLFSPTLQLQHTTLATYHDTHSMPLDYASYQVDLNQLEEAIETLERGRALLWSEMRHLRTSIDRLLEAHPDLGHKFAAVNRDLEELTKSVPPTHKLSMDGVATDDLRAVDPFSRLLLKQRGLLKEREKLISQIQTLPGFDRFLTSPSFDTLRSAASSGPVIIINHSEWRSDILILFHNSSPSLISTPSDFYGRAGALKDRLLESRLKDGLDSNKYDETLGSVLAELYDLVGKPVIRRLRHLQVPEHSRIWWYPTSVFCSLPLHAMGPIPSDGGETRYFLDLYICSYTPTLSALIQSRHRNSGSRSSVRPSVLLVAQPDPSLPTVGGEIQVVQALDTSVSSLISAAATPAAVVYGFRDHQFVHFACHGTLEPGKPFEAGFELHGGERLTLLEIVRSHIPAAEFAFLSACHTAEITEGSIMDEGLHLAAAVQYCGFRSVVGTMWAMVDEDGRDLAENFYKALFSNSRGTPYHERSAKALRFAVKKLRRKRRITLERWVNFVHYGA